VSYPASASRYYESSVNTASPIQLVVMLYQGAIRQLKQAAEHIERRNLEGKRISIDKAMAIVQQLHGSLDMEKGGQIAADLDRLYAYVTTRILEGSASLNVRPIEEAASVLITLSSAWEQLSSSEAPASEPVRQLGAIKA
jgi:flagellar protein FliS